MTDDTGHLGKLMELGLQLDRLLEEGQWAKWLKVASRFHRYSAGNQLLIWSQRPDATLVAGYKAWKQKGRQVRRGEKAIKIIAPMLLAKVDDNGEDTVAIRFKVASVFDVTQTDGAPLDLPDTDTVWSQVTVPDAQLFERLVPLVHARSSYTVTMVDFALDGAMGWCRPATGEISVVRNQPGTMVNTLLHELGHLGDPLIKEDTVSQSKELVAESSAWLVAQQLNVECTLPSTVYLASWKGDSAGLLALAERVIASARATESIVHHQEALT